MLQIILSNSFYSNKIREIENEAKGYTHTHNFMQEHYTLSNTLSHTHIVLLLRVLLRLDNVSIVFWAFTGSRGRLEC